MKIWARYQLSIKGTNYPSKVPNSHYHYPTPSSPSKQGRLRHDIPYTQKSVLIYLYILVYVQRRREREGPEVRKELGPLRIRLFIRLRIRRV